MLAFIDFEASSLAERSYPIEVAWVFADGTHETHLIRPAPRWTDWDSEAEAIHGLSREQLLTDGEPHEQVARRMVEALAGHDLCASAPSWDGKWLSALLLAAEFPRHTLRLRDTDEVLREAAEAILAPVVPAAQLDPMVAQLLALAAIRDPAAPPAHRALPDARQEWQRWLDIRDAAGRIAAGGTGAAAGIT
jgi:hypothetical protein